MKDEDNNLNKDRQSIWPSPNEPNQEKAEGMNLGGIFLFSLIGATATTLAVRKLWRTVDWVCSQLSRSQSSWKGTSGKTFRSSFQEEAWKRYNRRMQEQYEEEMERVERIRRMQNVFNRERNKYKRGFESWGDSGPGPGAYHQHYQRDDWYWKADRTYSDRRTNYREAPRNTPSFSLSHHYSVLGLERFRSTPYTEAEIKKAFQAKAKQFHPDQNQDNKEAAEVKFKEVMTSYEAIKQERKNTTM